MSMQYLLGLRNKIAITSFIVVVCLGVVSKCSASTFTSIKSKAHIFNEVKQTLKENDMYSEGMYKLLLGTAATESDFGKITKQIGGPALGIFQMEPATHQDIWQNYLAFHPKLRQKVLKTKWDNIPWQTQLRYNVKYQTMMSTVHYQRVLEFHKQTLDKNPTVWTMAWFYKMKYNTKDGKGSTTRFFRKYKEYVSN